MNDNVIFVVVEYEFKEVTKLFITESHLSKNYEFFILVILFLVI